MPGKDGTGPMGMGPMSGRGFGLCAGYPPNAFAGCGVGFGHGHGFRRMAQATGIPGWKRFGYPMNPEFSDPTQRKVILENQAKFLENQLEQVKNQLKEFKE